MNHFLAVSIVLALPLGAVEPLAFNRDIRPILSKTCFTCHGPDAAAVKSELRLDIRDRALKGGESGKPAIVPGKPEESMVVKHITSTDPEEVMPPPKAHMKFTAEDAAKLTRWIKEGAVYEGHWAFQTPKKTPLPELADASPNPIDHFVAAKLKAEKLPFSPEADRPTLIRRVSFDLTGLPPTNLSTFDAPNREICSIGRLTTNTRSKPSSPSTIHSSSKPPAPSPSNYWKPRVPVTATQSQRDAAPAARHLSTSASPTPTAVSTRNSPAWKPRRSSPKPWPERHGPNPLPCRRC